MKKIIVCSIFSLIFVTCKTTEPSYLYEFRIDEPAEVSLVTNNDQSCEQDVALQSEELRRCPPHIYFYSQSHYAPSEYECFIHRCSQWEVKHFAEYFNYLLRHDHINEDPILSSYRLYEFPAFCAYIKQLSGYEKHIAQLHKKMHCCADCKKELIGITGIAEREMKRVICPMAQEIKQNEKERQRRARERERQRVVAQTYQITDQTASMLNSLGYNANNYIHFSGNALQQAIHRKFVDIVNHAAEIRTDRKEIDPIRQFSDVVVEFADIGREYNANRLEQHATRVVNFCISAMQCVDNICMGAGEGIYLGTSRLILHPIDSITGLAEGAAATGEALFCLLLESAKIQTAFELDPQMGFEKLDEFGEKFDVVYKAIKKECAKLSARDWSRLLVSGAVECYLQFRLLKAAGSFFKIAKKQMHVLAQKDPAILKNKELLLGHAEGVQVYAAEKAASLLCSDSHLFGLTLQKDGTWISKVGLIYGRCKKFGNRAYHVLDHMRPDSKKRIHTVFNVSEYELFDLIDQAWMRKGQSLVGDPGVYIVEMGKVIGTKGETAIRIVTKPNTTEIISVYPSTELRI